MGLRGQRHRNRRLLHTGDSMRVTTTIAFAAIAATIVFAGAASAATIPVQCQATKHKVAGSLAKCLHTAQGKLVSGGDIDAYDDAVAKCTAKFSGKWSGAEQKATDLGGSCQTTSDAAEVSASVAANVACIAGALQTGDGVCLLCGNGSIDAGEECDIGNVGGATCISATAGSKPLGTLSCAAGCVLDTSACTDAAELGFDTWYIGASGASCDETCGARGLAYDLVTAVFAGEGGTDRACTVVLAALGYKVAVVSSPSSGLGCFYDSGTSLGNRYLDMTTSSASSPGKLRVCACH